MALAMALPSLPQTAETKEALQASARGASNVSSPIAKQKCNEAAHALVGDKNLRVPLTYAALSLVRLEPSDLPPDMRTEFKELKSDLTIEPLSTTIGYIPRRVSPQKARKLAQKIVDMYTKLLGGP